MVIQHNISALNSHRQLAVNNQNTAKNLEKLSSGFKINRAGDDAAGLAISEKMRGQIRGLAKAEENASNAIALIQTAEGGMQELHNIVQRMRELAVQASNGTYHDEVDRENLNDEFQQLIEEIDRITEYTEYNAMKLLNGDKSGAAVDALLQSHSILFGGKNGITLGDNVASMYDRIAFDTINHTMGTDVRASAAFDIGVGSTLAVGDSADFTITWQDGKSTTVTITATGTPMDEDDIANAIFADATVARELAARNMSVTTAASGNTGRIVLSGDIFGEHSVNWGAIDLGITNAPATVLSAGTGPINDGSIDATSTITFNVNYFMDGVPQPGSPVAVTLTRAGNFDGATGLWTWADGDGNEFVFSEEQLRLTGSPSTGTMSLLIKDGTLVFQVGPNGTEDQRISLAIDRVDSKSIGLGGGSNVSVADLDILNQQNAQDSIVTMDQALNDISVQRSKLGAVQNRLEYTMNNIGVTKENLTAAESTIRDTDMAKEMMEFTKNSILMQSAQAMLAQANTLPQGVLNLLR